MVACDENRKLISASPMAERILGIDPEHIGQTSWTDAHDCYLPDVVTPYPPEQLPISQALQGKEVSDELIFVRTQRHPAGIWISANGRPIRDSAGAFRGAVMVFRDVTESQNLLRENQDGTSLQEARQEQVVESSASSGDDMGRFEQYRAVYSQLSKAVEQTADSVVITNRRGFIEYVNPAFEQITGYTRNEVLGRTPGLLKSGLHDEKFYQDLWNQILSGKPFKGTIINRKKSGEIYWSEQTITPIRDEQQQITHFVSVLKDLTELRKRQEQDFYLGLAREIQQRFYNITSDLPGFDIAGAAHSADDTGGDYFDVIVQPDGCVYLVIGDVSGHGFGAALVMAETRAFMRSFARFDSDPGSLLSNVNRFLVDDLESSQYVTLAAVRLDPRSKSIEYASAGHVPCYVLRSSGEIGFNISSTGPPLGFFPEFVYSSSPVSALNSGDTIVLLTDGVTESENIDKEEFGAERVLEFVNNHPQASARELVQGIYSAARDFAAGAPQNDDITSLFCRVGMDETTD